MVQQLNRVRALEERVRAGGGEARIRKQHAAGKLTARERIELLLDPASRFFEVGLLVAWDKYDGQAPAAGVVTGLGRIEGRVAVVVANDATVKAGAWWPETIAKILRAQEIAMRNRIPIVYLVDSAGVNLPLQDGIFPGQYGAGRIFYYNSLMRRKFRIPQIAAVMGPCIAGGAYIPALSDVMVMVEGTSFMGLGGPNLVKGATGAAVDAESLGGAGLHNRTSGVAHYRAADDAEAIRLIRTQFRAFPAPAAAPAPGSPARPPSTLCDILPEDHRMSYDAGAIAAAIFDQADFLEFQPEYAPELLCAQAKLAGRPVALIANRRGFREDGAGTAHRRRHLHRVRPQSQLLRGVRQPAWRASVVSAGHLRLHGGQGGRERRHHPRRSGDGGEHGVRERAENRAHHQPCQRCRVLRHGRSRLRSALHSGLAQRRASA